MRKFKKRWKRIKKELFVWQSIFIIPFIYLLVKNIIEDWKLVFWIFVGMGLFIALIIRLNKWLK